MKIRFLFKDLASNVAKEIACAYATAQGMDPDSAKLIGASVGGIVSGLSGFSIEQSNMQRLKRIIKDAIKEAIHSEDFELPSECANDLLAAFSPENVVQLCSSSQADRDAMCMISEALRQSPNCDIHTLPIKKITRDILEYIHTKLNEDSDLINPVLLEASKSHGEKLDTILALLQNMQPTGRANSDPVAPTELTNSIPNVERGFVIHRETEIGDLLALLQEGKTSLLLCGFGGIGKTSLARLLFHEIKGNYDAVAWIPYNGTLEQSVLASVQLFAEISNTQARLQAILSSLKNDGKRKLIVIDNADSNEERKQEPSKDPLLKNITGWANTTVIVTSRFHSLGDCYTPFPVDFLSPDACLDLFFRHCEHPRTTENAETAQAFIHDLAKYHTLTVELLAKGAAFEASLSGFYQELKNKGFSFPTIQIETSAADPTAPDVTATIAQHLKTLFKLRTRPTEQTKLLQCFAALPTGAAFTKNEIENWFGFDINLAEPLVKSGWLSRNMGQYTLHPLIKEVILLDELPQDNCADFLCYIEDYHNGFFPSGEIYTATIRKIEIVESVLASLKVETNTIQFAHIFHNTASAYNDLADYDKALAYDQKALDISEAKLGTDHPNTATTYNNIAGVYRAKGDYDNALRFYQKALEIREAKLGTDHPDTATTYNNIAAVYQGKGDYDNALKFYQKASKIFEAKLGTDHPDTATTYNNIALVYCAKGDYDNALRFHQKALEIREAKSGTDHPDTALTYMNLGSMQYQTESYQDGLANLLKAYRIFAFRLGIEHPYTKAALRWLPDCYDAAYPSGEPFESWLSKQLEI